VSTCNSLEPLDNPRIRYKRKQGYPSDYSPQKSPQSLDAAPSPVLVSRQRKAPSAKLTIRPSDGKRVIRRFDLESPAESALVNWRDAPMGGEVTDNPVSRELYVKKAEGHLFKKHDMPFGSDFCDCDGCLQDRATRRERRRDLLGHCCYRSAGVDHPYAVFGRPIPGLPSDRRSSQGLWIYQAHLRGYRGQSSGKGRRLQSLKFPSCKHSWRGPLPRWAQRKDGPCELVLSEFVGRLMRSGPSSLGETGFPLLFDRQPYGWRPRATGSSFLRGRPIKPQE